MTGVICNGDQGPGSLCALSIMLQHPSYEKELMPSCDVMKAFCDPRRLLRNWVIAVHRGVAFSLKLTDAALCAVHSSLARVHSHL